MQRTDHWNDQNTTALIQGISGLAGSFIKAKQQGGQLTPQEIQVMNLAQQTQNALYNAQQNGSAPPQSALGVSQTTLIIIGGIVLLVIGFLLFKNR